MNDIKQREFLHVIVSEVKLYAGVKRRLPEIDWRTEFSLQCKHFGHVLESDGTIINCMICRDKWQSNGEQYILLPK